MEFRVGAGTGVKGLGFTATRFVERFRGGLVFKAHRLCVSLNSRLEGNKEEEKFRAYRDTASWCVCV